MVYLGPIQSRPVSVKVPSRPSATTAVSAYANEQRRNTRSAGLDGSMPSGRADRRKKQDRRNKSAAPILETRAGRDRRRSLQPSISISI